MCTQLEIMLPCCVTGAWCIRDVSIQVPPTVSVGSDVFLRCLFDVEGDNLYMLKWYRGKDEFYRYVPKELPSTQVFSLPGFKVDVSQKQFFFATLSVAYAPLRLVSIFSFEFLMRAQPR